MYFLFIFWLFALFLAAWRPKWAPIAALVTLGFTALWTAVA